MRAEFFDLRFAGLVLLLFPIVDASAQSIYEPYWFTNFAGQPGIPGITDGTPANFKTPHSIAVDKADNLYVSDTLNHTVRKITPSGVVTTVAGSPGSGGYLDGVGTSQPARFKYPSGISIDGTGNFYIGDNLNHTIRKITPEAVVTTIAGHAGVYGNADGTGAYASFRNPEGTAVDSAGNIFVADNFNWTIRKITPTGEVTLFAGSAGLQGTNDGVGTAARFYQPMALAIDKADNIYVADLGGQTIRKITPEAVVTTFAGQGRTSGTNDGVGATARFSNPQGVAVDVGGNIYVSDSYNATIRKITPEGLVTTIAGAPGQFGYSDGTNSTAQFGTPKGIAVDASTNIYVADSGWDIIRKLAPTGTNWVVTTIAGSASNYGDVDAIGSLAKFRFLEGLALDSTGNIYVVESGNHDIRKITPSGVVTTFAGVGGFPGSEDGSGAAALFNRPENLTVDDTGNIYVVESVNNTVRKISPVGTNWIITTIAGCATCPGGTNNGVGTDARFHTPVGLTRDSSGNLYVGDTGNNTIRKLTPSGDNWLVSTFAGKAGEMGGSDGSSNAARFWSASDLAADITGNLYVSDFFAIRKISSAGIVSTLAGCQPNCTNGFGSADGPGDVARFYVPRGITIDVAGNLYVTDSTNATIRKLTPSGSNWVVRTLAGRTGLIGAVDGIGFDARFSQPTGVTVDSTGQLYVVDSGTSRVIKGAESPSRLQFEVTDGSLTVVSNGFFQMRVTGTPGGSVILDETTNFSSWTPIQTNDFSTGGVTLTVPISSGPRNFFRMRLRQ